MFRRGILKIEWRTRLKIVGLNPKPILTNRLVGLKPPGPVAQLVERGAYTFMYTYSNAKVAGSSPAWTKFFYVYGIHTVKKIYFLTFKSRELTLPSTMGKVRVPV